MTAVDDRPTTEVGSARKRKEDQRLITGRTKWTDNIQRQGMQHLAMVRSPFAHATITRIDTSAAKASPGVLAVLTGEDVKDIQGGMANAWPITEDQKAPVHPAIAVDHVAFAGEIVAVVIARSAAAARDAAELVDVDYDELPPVLDLRAAATDEVLAHPSLGTNKSAFWQFDSAGAGTGGSIDEAIEKARADGIVIEREYRQQRLIPAFMEPRSVVCDPTGEQLTIWTATQVPHFVRIFTALVLGIPESKIRVIAPDVGGGFGGKLQHTPEEVIAVLAARHTGKPVKYTETRSESLLSAHHGRDQWQKLTLTATKDGTVTGLKVDLLADMGAYLGLVTSGIPVLGAFMFNAIYKFPAYQFNCTNLFTNKTWIKHEEFPFTTVAGMTYDSGNYEAATARARELFDYDGLRREQLERRERKDPVQLGIGVSTFTEMCGLAPSRVLGALRYAAGGWEHASIRMLPTGKVEVVTGTSPHGQGHETVWSQIIADRFGVPFDDVEVLHGDTQIANRGLDTYGSRSLVVGGQALVMAADRVIEKAKPHAAHLLEASVDDIEFSGGQFKVKGTDNGKAMAEVVWAAFASHDLPEGLEPTLDADATYDPVDFSFPHGTHLCAMEVDTETGQVSMRKYVCVDDIGNIMNPLIVEGQVHGGLVQGIAQALWEEAVYDDQGTLVSGSFVDYTLPTAADTISFVNDNTVSPATGTALGAKGVGEAGTIASTPAVVNAIVDALRPLGIDDIQMPCTPERVWRAIQSAGRNQSDATTGAAQPHFEES